MSAPRRLSTRGMEPPKRIRPLLDVDTTLPEIDDMKRCEMSDNYSKFRRITEPIWLEKYIPRRDTPVKKPKLFEVQSFINPFSLAKLAYMSCSEEEREDYNTQPTPHIEVKECCYFVQSRNPDVMKYALEYDHLECFKHGHKFGVELPRWSCYIALSFGSVKILQYAHENNCDFVVNLAFKEAALNGDLPCFEYIHKVGGVLTTKLMKAVVIHGCLDILKYLLKNGCEWTIDMCALSATSGDLDFVKYCHNAGCPWAVVDPSHWYVLSANLGFIMEERKQRSIDLVKGMKECIKYIESTAVIGDHCELKNYVGIKMMSIEL